MESVKNGDFASYTTNEVMDSPETRQTQHEYTFIWQYNVDDPRLYRTISRRHIQFSITGIKCNTHMLGTMQQNQIVKRQKVHVWIAMFLVPFLI